MEHAAPPTDVGYEAGAFIWKVNEFETKGEESE